MRARPLALALVAALVAVAGVALAENRLAVVDLQHAVMQTEDGMRAQAMLKKLFDRRQQELDRKQGQLGADRESIEKQSQFLSRRALQRRLEIWQAQMVELQTVFVEYNKELQKKQNELTQPIISKMLGVVRRIATGRGIDMVIDKQAVPYTRADLDLTDMVVQAYNSGGDAPPPDEPPKAP
ncbi:MAG: OmpH family outer membrane protein [Myxococcales bacterium]|nr:OmpH family outer membrane protein [Myxococcales bacterium]